MEGKIAARFALTGWVAGDAQAHWHGVAAASELPAEADWRKRKRVYRKACEAYRREWNPRDGWRD